MRALLAVPACLHAPARGVARHVDAPQRRLSCCVVMACRGPQKLYDNITPSSNPTNPADNSLAMTSAGNNPYFIVEYGTSLSNVGQIRIQARADSNLAQSNNLDVLLGNSTSINAATKIATGVTFATLGENKYIAVPAGASFTHIFVQRMVTNDVIALQEVEALVDGEHACMHMCAIAAQPWNRTK